MKATCPVCGRLTAVLGNNRLCRHAGSNGRCDGSGQFPGTSQPSPQALAAAGELIKCDVPADPALIAAVIDRETNLPGLLAACNACNALGPIIATVHFHDNETQSILLTKEQWRAVETAWHMAQEAALKLRNES